MCGDWPGEIYWRKLQCRRDLEFVSRMEKAHSMVHNRFYDLLPQDWLKVGLDIGGDDKRQRTRTFYCSALVAFVYVQLGFLPEETDWTMIRPKDLGTEDDQGRNVKLHLFPFEMGHKFLLC